MWWRLNVSSQPSLSAAPTDTIRFESRRPTAGWVGATEA
jgi:hypothetical protein